MRLRDVLDRADLRLTLLTGDGERLERAVNRVYTTDLLDPRRYLSGGEIVLTGLMWRRTPDDSKAFVGALVEAGVAALGAGDAALGSVPADLVAACRRHGLPLFEVPVEVSFRAITDAVTPSLWAERASGLAALLGRQRGLVAAVAGGAPLDELLPLAATELGVRSWAVTATGRLLAGSAPLDPDLSSALARAFLATDRLPRTVTVTPGRTFSLYSVPGRPEHRLTAWCLASEGRGASHPYDEPDAGTELAGLVALERARLEEGRRVERRLAGELATALVGGETTAELRGRLRSCGLPPDGTYLALVASVPGGVSPGAGTAAAGELAAAVIEELLESVAPGATAVAPLPDTDDRALAVTALPSGEAEKAIEAARHGVPSLLPGLGGGRLAVGVSDPAPGPAGLAGAVEEAGHAHGLAVVRDERACLVSCAELASHVLLLAAVPEPARRSFRSRLLGPLEAYDREHDADLVRTLDAFLANSGSWSRCASRLHLHVNTLRYRLHRIEELTGRDLRRLEDRVDFFLALRLPGP
ncbi:MAG TPA: PucR family transcriptional regulator ligand-binding domain-containing protein [Micromonosporaceae bacterium]|jgi:hypothetical protein